MQKNNEEEQPAFCLKTIPTYFTWPPPDLTVRTQDTTRDSHGSARYYGKYPGMVLWIDKNHVHSYKFVDMLISEKIRVLIQDTRVMTLAVSKKDVPWSSPVYFVFYDNRFYFFSNDASAHIQHAGDKKTVSVSIFQDSDNMDMIFGLQMSGKVEKVSGTGLYLNVVKKYVKKFDFLYKIFGPEVIRNRHFFLEKFTSSLYCFYPERIFMSDNSRTTTGSSRELDPDVFGKIYGG